MTYPHWRVVQGMYEDSWSPALSPLGPLALLGEVIVADII